MANSHSGRSSFSTTKSSMASRSRTSSSSLWVSRVFLSCLAGHLKKYSLSARLYDGPRDLCHFRDANWSQFRG